MIVRGVGKVLIGAGLVVLLLVAYELWGTGLVTSSHQNALRQQFERDLRAHQGVTPPNGTTPATQPTQTVQNPVPPPSEGQPIGIIDIPKIGSNYVVVEGTSTDDLERGPGHYTGTSLPGNPGNAAIAGHRTTYLKPFYSLDQLARGDPIYVTTFQGRFQYKVVDTLLVSPDDVAVLNPTASPILTLTTCNPRYSAETRMVVQASLVSPEFAAVPTTKSLPRPRSLADGRGGWSSAALWALACLAFGTVVWLMWRRRRKWWVPMVGLVGLLVLFFFFFGAVNPLLPAGY